MRPAAWLLSLSAVLSPAAAQASGRVAITEIYYHPPSSRGERVEFVELKNLSPTETDLSGWRIEGGVRFEFPPGTRLAPGAYAIVCRDAHAFSSQFSSAEPLVAGTYEGQLDNAGDAVDLFDAFGAFVDGTTYGDRRPWPEAADGGGASLDRLCETSPARDPANWAASSPPTPGAPNPQAACPPPEHRPPDVVISEVFYHPEGPSEEHPADEDGEDDEYVEIHNRSGAAVDLSGWTLGGGIAFEFPRGSTVAPDERLVVCRAAGRFRERYGIQEVLGDFSGRLSNRGERIVLEDAFGRYVDSVDYRDSGEWPYAADGFGHSLERVSSDLPSHDPANWAAGEPPSRAFQRLSGTGGLGQGLVQKFILSLDAAGDEVVVDDVVLEDLAEPGVNLLDNGDFELGSDGWQVAGVASGSTFEGGIGAGGSTALWLRASGPCPGGECGVANGVSRTVERGLVRGHTYRVTLSARYVRGGLGFRAGLFRGAGVKAGWFFTPGRPNSVASERLRLQISKVSRHPREPTSSDPVWITALVRASEAPEVLLSYEAGGPSASLAMADDGQHRDGLAGDGVFGVEVPPFPHNTQVRFRIRARAGGAEATFPAPRSPTAPLAEEVWGYYVNDLQPRSPLPVYHLLLDGFDPREPQAVNGVLSCLRLTKGSFAHRGDLYPDVSVRFRGNTACYIQKRNFKVIFNRGRLFRELRKINLNGLWTDKAIVREHLAWDFFRRIGAPYMETEFVRLHLSGVYHGLFLYVEHPSEDFLGRNGLNERANLYKAVQPPWTSGETPIGVERWPTAEKYRANWEREVNEMGDYSDLVEFVSSMHDDGSSPGGPTTEFWSGRTFEEMILRYQIAQVVLNNIDSFAKNHFLYHDLDLDRWGIIGWDMDLVLGKFFTTDAVQFPDRPVGTLNDLMLSDPEIRGDLNPWFASTVNGGYRLNWLIDFFFRAGGGRYRRALLVRLSEVLDELYRNEVYDRRMDELAAFLEDEEREDHARWGRYASNVPGFPEDMLSNIEIAKRQIRLHRDFLLEYMDFYHRAEVRHPKFQIVEILYLPEDGDEDLEFLEFVNLSGETVDISGWSIPAVRYTFPDGSVIRAGEPVVVAKSPAAFVSRYRDRRIPNLYGPYEGRLANEGEEIALLDAGPGYPATIDRVRYDAREPWPTPPPGHSIELLVTAARGDNDDPANWTVSSPSGGSPGSFGAQFVRGDANSDEAINLTDAVFVLGALFLGGHEPPCWDAADANDDGTVNLTDPVYLLNFLFLSGPAIPPPYPEKGVDTTEDSLGCEGAR